MAVILANELPRFGCDVDVDEFHEIVLELKQVICPDWTDEELMFHPEDALVYVNAVRSRVHCTGIPAHLILRTLVKLRKNSQR